MVSKLQKKSIWFYSVGLIFVYRVYQSIYLFELPTTFSLYTHGLQIFNIGIDNKNIQSCGYLGRPMKKERKELQ